MNKTSASKKPRGFIGSSAEGLEIAEAIHCQLSRDAEITIWSAGVFGLGDGTLESLEKALERFDFAILVLTPDDLVVSRRKASQAPRDNVLLELGMFIGRLGRKRTFVVCGNDIKLPSDLAGVTVTHYEANRSDNNLEAAVIPACSRIRGALRARPARPRRKRTLVLKLFL